MGGIVKFMLILGPISSIFDYATFYVLIRFFGGWTHPELFRTGWFVESLCTQILVIHVIRTNKIPFFQSRSSWPVMVASVLVVALGAWLPVSPLAGVLGFVPLPVGYWLWLAGILVGYVVVAQLVKTWFYQIFPE